LDKKTSSCDNPEYCLTLDGCSVKSLSLVKNLGVLFEHKKKVNKTMFKKKKT